MSQSLTLVQYGIDDLGALYESKSHIIETSFITPGLISIFEMRGVLTSVQLYEEPGSTEFSEIRCIQPLSVDESLVILENEFVKALDSDLANQAKTLVTPEISSLIVSFRTITNLHHLIKLKKDKFEHRPNVVVQLG